MTPPKARVLPAAALAVVALLAGCTATPSAPDNDTTRSAAQTQQTQKAGEPSTTGSTPPGSAGETRAEVVIEAQLPDGTELAAAVRSRWAAAMRTRTSAISGAVVDELPPDSLRLSAPGSDVGVFDRYLQPARLNIRPVLAQWANPQLASANDAVDPSDAAPSEPAPDTGAGATGKEVPDLSAFPADSNPAMPTQPSSKDAATIEAWQTAAMTYGQSPGTGPSCAQVDRFLSLDDPDLPLLACDQDGLHVYLLDRTLIPGTELKGATATDGNDGWAVAIDFKSDGYNTWSAYTTSHVGMPTAFTFDSQVLVAPVISEPVTTPGTVISNGLAEASAADLAGWLNFGALPLAFDVTTKSVITGDQESTDTTDASSQQGTETTSAVGASNRLDLPSSLGDFTDYATVYDAMPRDADSPDSQRRTAAAVYDDAYRAAEAAITAAHGGATAAVRCYGRDSFEMVCLRVFHDGNGFQPMSGTNIGVPVISAELVNTNYERMIRTPSMTCETAITFGYGPMTNSWTPSGLPLPPADDLLPDGDEQARVCQRTSPEWTVQAVVERQDTSEPLSLAVIDSLIDAAWHHLPKPAPGGATGGLANRTKPMPPDMALPNRLPGDLVAETAAGWNEYVAAMISGALDGAPTLARRYTSSDQDAIIGVSSVTAPGLDSVMLPLDPNWVGAVDTRRVITVGATQCAIASVLRKKVDEAPAELPDENNENETVGFCQRVADGFTMRVKLSPTQSEHVSVADTASLLDEAWKAVMHQ